MIRPKPAASRQLLDDQLLDALGQGLEPPAGSDPLVTGLAGWRNDLSAQIRPAALDLAAVLHPVPAVAGHRLRWRRLIAGAGAALVAASGGGAVTVAAAGAGPDSPLWPITRLVYPERAEARLAQLAVEEVVAEARVAVADQRYAAAERLLGEAEQLATQVPGAAERQRLLAEVSQVRGLIPVRLPAGELPPAGQVPPAGELPPVGELLPDGGERLPLPEEPGTGPVPRPVPPPAGEPTPTPTPDPVPAPEPSPSPVLPTTPRPPLPPLPPLG